MQPGRQSLNYYRCVHIATSIEINNNITKFNWAAVAVLVFSIAIHIILNIRIKLYKYNLQKSVQILQKYEQTKQSTLYDFDKNAIVDFSKSAFILLLSAFGHYSFSAFVNEIHPTRAGDFPNNLIVFLYNCVIPCCATTVLLLIYYLRNSHLVRSLYMEIKVLIGSEESL